MKAYILIYYRDLQDRTRGSVRYSYEGKVPPYKKRAEMAGAREIITHIRGKTREARHLDFDTSKSNGGDRQPSGRGGSPNFSTRTAVHPGQGFVTSRPRHSFPNEGEKSGDFRIPAGSRKAALVYPALEAWRKYLLNPTELGEVRGREVDEARLQRALYRSSMSRRDRACPRATG
jgi:hypothetical protein